MHKNYKSIVIIFSIPLLAFVLALVARWASGPFWLALNIDPAYQYLINGLYLLKGYVPNHVDHPGTPLQMFSCSVSWFLNAGQSNEAIVLHVLKDPEFYLNAIFFGLSLLTLISSLGLGFYLYRKTKDPVTVLLVQLPLISLLMLKSWEANGPALPVAANVFPETMLIAVMNLFNIFLFRMYFAQTKRSRLLTVIMGAIVTGLGVALKITVLPIILAVVIILSLEEALIFVLFFALSFWLGTFPIHSKYPAMIEWYRGLATPPGSQGERLKEGLMYSMVLAKEQWFWIALVLLGFVRLLLQFLKGEINRGTRFLTALLATVAADFLFVMQHPGEHYFLPGLALMGPILVLLYLQTPMLGRKFKSFIIAGIFLFVAVSVIYAGNYLMQLRQLTTSMLDFRQEVQQHFPSCTAVYYYRSSDPVAALFFGDGWNLSPRLSPELYQLYPNAYYYNEWGNSILDFQGRIYANDLLVQNPCLLFVGDGSVDFKASPYQLKFVKQGPDTQVEQVTATSEKQAAELVEGAVMLYQQHEPQRAMLLLQEAKMLHYQPESTIENLAKAFIGNTQ